MAPTLLFSDVHLSPARPAIQDALIALLAGPARRAAAVYILGDLFEYWVGDDAAPAEFEPVLEALKALSDSGVPIFFQRGNRDFLIGEGFARRTGVSLLDDPDVIDLYGHRVVLTHGDLLCTADVGYQRYRRVVHNRALQRLFLALPRHRRYQLAARLRKRTQAAVRHKAATTMDMDTAAGQALLDRFQAHWLIHGHTHRPAVHRLDDTASGRLRIDLGDWYREGRGIWIDAQGPHPFTLPLPASS